MKRSLLVFLPALCLTIAIVLLIQNVTAAPTQTAPNGNPTFPNGIQGSKGIKGLTGPVGDAGPAGDAGKLYAPVCVLCKDCGGSFPTYVGEAATTQPPYGSNHFYGWTTIPAGGCSMAPSTTGTNFGYQFAPTKICCR